MKTYTPGYLGLKLVSVVVSLLVCAGGIAEMWFPASLAFSGRIVKSVVVKVEKTSPGLPTKVYTTTSEIPEDKNRSAIFWHYVAYTDASGQERTAKLNIATKIKPASAYAVGAKVRIACPKGKPEVAVAVFDWQTWALGFFILIVGLVYASISILFAVHANRPIEVQDELAEGDQGHAQPSASNEATAETKASV